jgi:hypothetical protein
MKKVLKMFVLLMVFSFAASSTFAQLSVSISVGIAPPALPVYVQPACPTDGYLWQPGYWAYSQDDDDYYWVPGVWVSPPNSGLYWTPAYWGYEGGSYGFHSGYWGAHVGFYGGINYGFGYGGVGFVGGAWSGGGFRYNTAVVNVNTTVVHNTYIDRTVINVNVNNHTSFNGPGGVTARPTQQEQAAMHEHHVQPTADQVAHQRTAMADKSQFSKVNNGKPVAAAMDKVHGTAYGPKGHAAPATPQARQQALTTRANNQRNAGGNAQRQQAAPNQRQAGQASANAVRTQQPAKQQAQKSLQQQRAAQRVRQQHKQAPKPKPAPEKQNQ